MKKIEGWSFPNTDLNPAMYAVQDSTFDLDDEKAPRIDTSRADPTDKDSMDPLDLLPENMRNAPRAYRKEGEAERFR